MAEQPGKSEERGFRVEDRRRVSADPGRTKERPEEPEREAEEAERRSAAGSMRNLPEISFSTFVISLSTQTLVHLGEVASPLTGQMEKDLSAAKQMIDILGVLEEKTRGNLDAGEKRLIEDVLCDLRLKYVEAVRKGG
jgi:hypothetical protein